MYNNIFKVIYISTYHYHGLYLYFIVIEKKLELGLDMELWK